MCIELQINLFVGLDAGYIHIACSLRASAIDGRQDLFSDRPAVALVVPSVPGTNRYIERLLFSCARE